VSWLETTEEEARDERETACGPRPTPPCRSPRGRARGRARRPALWSELVQEWLGYTAPQFPGWRLIEPLFGSAVFFYGGLVFLRGALRELRSRRPGMMTLISLAIAVAFVFSAAVELGFPGMPLWWELATLVTIMLLGHWMEMRSITQAQGALRELAKLLPSTATRLAGEKAEPARCASK
jgi:Cu2+-exporting ATPase